MDYVIRFVALIIATSAISKIYEKRQKNESLIISIYFAIVGVIFLL